MRLNGTFDLSCFYLFFSMLFLQVLLIQNGKLYGRDPIFLVICKASALPESLKDLDIQKNEAVLQLGQVM